MGGLRPGLKDTHVVDRTDEGGREVVAELPLRVVSVPHGTDTGGAGVATVCQRVDEEMGTVGP